MNVVDENRDFMLTLTYIMKIIKVTKDRLVRLLSGKSFVPVDILELHKYFRLFGPIVFKYHKESDIIISISENFQYGSIIAHGRTMEELDRNTRDAILSAFGVPSAYKKEAALVKGGEHKDAYAIA